MALTKVSYSMIQGATFNVLDYGADSTGVSSASAAIQNAINAAYAAGGGVVTIPAGVFLITTSMQLKTNVSVFGVGGTATQLKFQGNNINCFYGAAVENVDIARIYFNGMKPTAGWETPNNYDFGIRLGNGATSNSVKNIRVYECLFKDIALDGIYVENYTNVQIYDCNFVNCRRWGVVPQGGTYDGNNCNIHDCYFDQDYGGGPAGKEYPIGAVDCEPDVGNVYNLVYKNLTGKRNAIQIQATGPSVLNAVVEGCIVNDSYLQINNYGPYVVKNCRVYGDTGYFAADVGVDATPTPGGNVEVYVQNGRSPLISSDGRVNLLPADFGDGQFFTPGTSLSGTGAAPSYQLRYIDGKPAELQMLQLSTGTGYAVITQNVSATITSGDQVYLFFEVERLDTNVLNANFFELAITGKGTLFSGSVPQKTSTLIFAYRAPTTVVNPTVVFGLSGTVNAQVQLLIKKCFLLVNPSIISTQNLVAGVNPKAIDLGNVNPTTLDAYNRNAVMLANTAPVTITAFNGGYNGQTFSLHPYYYPVTLKHTTGPGENLKMVTYADITITTNTPPGTGYGITFVYNNGYWWQAS